MILGLLFRKEWMILISILLLAVVHNDIGASILEGVNDSNLHFIVNSGL